MIEQKMRSALLFLAGSLLAAGAWGQTVTFKQGSQDKANVALEYFGAAAREVTFDGDKQPKITLLIADDPNRTGDGTLDEDEKGQVTFVLNGASFASSVSASDLKFYDLGTGENIGAEEDTDETSAIRKRIVSGGQRGDSSVTFEMTVSSVIDPTDDTGDEFLSFYMPDLDVTPTLLNVENPGLGNGVTVVATNLRSVDSGSNPFPGRVLGTGAVVTAASAAGVTPVVTEQKGVDVVKDGTVLLINDRALTVGLGTGGAANVALADRKSITRTSGVEVTRANGDKVRGLMIGKMSLALANPAATAMKPALRVLRGDDLVVVNNRLDSTLSGRLTVAVNGPFQEGDQVFLGKNQEAQGAKVFEMSGGTAMLEFPLREAVTGDMVYVPGGVEDLQPGDFTASATLEFNDSLNASGPYPSATPGVPLTATGTLSYRGIKLNAYAHGVSRADDEAVTSFLRVTCTGAPDGCNVFLSCTDQDGNTAFDQIDASPSSEVIANNATEVFTSNEIAAALGGGWESGSGRCDLYSNGSLQVQHMIRTSGNALHNNSVVIGQGHTATRSIGIFRGEGTHSAGSVEVLANTVLQRLADGRLYGAYTAVSTIARSLGGVSGTPSEGMCGYISKTGAFTSGACLEDSDTLLRNAVPIRGGDIIYPVSLSYGVYRPARQEGYISLPMAASGAAPVLTR